MFINIDGKNVHYQEQGRGESILFIHGWGGTINSLQPLANLLSQTYKTITVDLPGFGKSDLPDPNWGVPEYSELLIKLIQKLKLGTIVYFGHSFGGSLGIYLAAKHPELFNRLILCNSAYKRENKTSHRVKTIKQNILSKIPFYFLWEAPIRKIVYRLFFRNSDLLQFPQLEPNFRLIMTQDLTSYLHNIHIPTLILWGEEDTYTPVSYAHELHTSISNSKLKIYPHSRHNLPLRFPELVAEEVNYFLKEKDT
jgi:pimeloyl-ACP methyl ester carboxylesterase